MASASQIAKTCTIGKASFRPTRCEHLLGWRGHYGKFMAEDGLVAAAKILAKTNSNAELCLVDEAVMDRRYGVLAWVAVLRLKLRTGKV